MARVKLPDNFDMLSGSGLTAVNGTSRWLNADTGSAVNVYSARTGGTTNGAGTATITNGKAVGWVDSGPTLQYYVTPSGSTEQGPFYWESSTNGSVGGYVADGSGIANQATPVQTQLSTGGLYADSGSGSLFHQASYVENTGSRATVAAFSAAKGQHVFAGNDVAYTDGAAHVAIGREIDFGNLNATPGGQAYGLLLKSLGGNVGGQGGQAFIQMQAATSSPADNGIVFHTSSGVSPVKSTGALIMTDSGAVVDRGINFSGSQFVTATIYAPLNSGSTTSSVGLLLSAEGGFANAGSFVDIRAGAASSSALHGIVFRLTGSNQPITGSLIRVQGAVTASVGLDLASGAFGAGIAMGDNNITVGTTTGMKIGTGATQKLGLYGATPTAQYATTGTATGFTAGAGTTATHLSTFTGNTGASAYTVGDLVKALKQIGLIAA